MKLCEVPYAIQKNWPRKGKELKPTQVYELNNALRKLCVYQLDYMQAVSYIEFLLNEPVTLRQFEQACKKAGVVYEFKLTR